MTPVKVFEKIFDDEVKEPFMPDKTIGTIAFLPKRNSVNFWAYSYLPGIINYVVKDLTGA